LLIISSFLLVDKVKQLVYIYASLIIIGPEVRMKVAFTPYTITVKFDSEDWTSGLARFLIGKIKKDIFYSHRRYNSEHKHWEIKKYNRYEEKLESWVKEHRANRPKSLEEMGDYPVEEFMGQFD
jgi:hypothetical protein